VNSVQRPDSFDAADYTGVLRRRWWIVVVCAVIGVVGAYAYTQVAPKTYTASAVVYVAATGADQANPGSSSKTTGPVNLNTEAQIVTSGAVGGAVRAGLRHRLPAEPQLERGRVDQRSDQEPDRQGDHARGGDGHPERQDRYPAEELSD